MVALFRNLWQLPTKEIIAVVIAAWSREEENRKQKIISHLSDSKRIARKRMTQMCYLDCAMPLEQ